MEVAEANAAVAAARDGESAVAAEHFDRAQGRLDAVAHRLDSWWAIPGRAVPIVGRQLDAVDTVIDAASDLARTGAALATSVDVERVRPRDGRVDLDAIRSFHSPLVSTEAVLDSVSTRVAGS